jgi:hypothetical protein
MLSRAPFQVSECTKGTGGACGAVFLSENFKAFLYKRLGSDVKYVLTPKRLSEAVKSFEANIKFSFDPFEPDCEEDFEISLPGAPDRVFLDLKDGYLTVTKYLPLPQLILIYRDEVKTEIFLPIFDKIWDLLEEQLVNVEGVRPGGPKV